MTVATNRLTPACVAAAQVFRNPLLEDPLPSRASGSVRQERAILVAKASDACANCPMFSTCLYDAVVTHDVYGFVAGTTARQRQEIRAELAVVLESEDFDTLAGVTAPNRKVDHAEVVRLRSANPTGSLEAIAHRLGCSLSTVKRHLRRERTGDVATRPASVAPTSEDVLDACASVVGGSRRRVA